MKTFEEKYTAWIDGKLSNAELAEFERELAKVDNAQTDRLAAQQLGSLLREHLRPAELKNADFFNHQLMQAINTEAGGTRQRTGAEHTPTAAVSEASPGGPLFWSMPRMIWAGICCLLMAGGLYIAAVPRTHEQIRQGDEYVARVLSVRTDDPAISASTYYDDENEVSVIWLSGLDYIPAEHKIQ